MSPPVAAQATSNVHSLSPAVPQPGGHSHLSPHLQRLEDEAIHILREVVEEFRKPLLLY